MLLFVGRVLSFSLAVGWGPFLYVLLVGGVGKGVGWRGKDMAVVVRLSVENIYMVQHGQLKLRRRKGWAVAALRTCKLAAHGSRAEHGCQAGEMGLSCVGF